MSAQQLTELEANLATLLIGVDSLWGGDALHESGAKHLIADQWISGVDPPSIYHDGFSVFLREKGGIQRGKEAIKVNDYVRKYNLRDLPEIVKVGASNFEQDRQRYVFNLVEALEVMLQTAIARVNKKPEPSFEERRRKATREEEIVVIDTSDLREELREALARVSYEVTPSRTLRETFIAYDKEKHFPSEQIAEQVSLWASQLLSLTREKIFPVLNHKEIVYWKHLSDVPFDGHQFRTINGQFFTGSQIYRGGEMEGKPLLQGLFEFNTDHHLTAMNLHHLCSHEIFPGHYLNSSLRDLLWRSGRLGFEATIATMCTADTIFEEGWAQNTYELLYGSRKNAIAELGDDLRVFFAFEDLQDIGKHNVAILHMRDKFSVQEVQQYIAEQCVQPDPIVRKLSGAWAQHPIIGPMYGPAYYLGKTIVNRAIQDKGAEKVIRAGVHWEGLVDIETFKTKVYRDNNCEGRI